MNMFFLVLLGFLVLLALIFAFGAAYITRNEGREREEFADQSRRRASEHQSDGREFYKSLGLGTGEQVKIRLFTLDEYRGDLGGDDSSVGDERFIGALKAYRQFDDDWYETPPEKAASPLDLGEDDYRLDEERKVLLLKKLPPGIPPAARDLFYT
ncbi:hypothetical protein BH20ACT11_BH20ACT11_08220 [soil metagenome]